MATIKLTDQLGLDFDAQPGEGSSLLKYFQQLPSLRLDSLDLSKLGGLTLDNPAIHSLSTGVSFSQPVTLGTGAPALSIGAGVHGDVQVVDAPDDLSGDDDRAKTPSGCRFVQFSIEASVSANVSAAAGGITFGASPSTEIKLKTCSRFPNAAGTSLIDALQETVAAIVIPAQSDDLNALEEGQVVSVDVDGKLKLSGNANLLAITNPLATVSLPAPLPALSVTAGGSATIGVVLTVETGYQVVAWKLDSGAVRLRWDFKRTDGISVDAKVSEGISAGIGTTDLFSTVIGIISANPKADLDELARAGVPQEQSEAIQSALKAAVSRKLEIALSAEISADHSSSTAFLFEIDPGKLNDQSRAALDQALGGDLTALNRAALPGITAVHSIWEEVSKRGLDLDVNLLGIVNFGSISKLALSGKVLTESATGAVVITDTATAERIQSTAVNFGADTDKLRHVLAESFLLTAAYKGTGALTGDASFRCTHHFFTLQQQTSPGDIKKDLRTGLALGLVSLTDTEPPPGISDFGRTLFTASADYDSDLVTGMFLDSTGAPLPRDVYENAGRAAIQFLVLPDDDDAIRLQPATDDVLWRHMKDTGQPGIPALFPGAAEPLTGAIVADYSTIQWWAEAMSTMGQHLAAFRQWHASHAAAFSDDPEFQKRRQDLADQLREIARTTREEFGAPWGLIAMSQLADHRAGARLMITGPRLTVEKNRVLALGTGK